MTERRRLVRVPASSANLGPGYDVMAAALSLFLELEVSEAEEFSLDPGGPDVPSGRDNLVVRAFETLHSADRLSFMIRSEIPLARGPRLERRGDRRRAGRRRPPLRAGADPRGDAGSRRGDRGAPGQRRGGDPRRLRDLRLRGRSPVAARFDPPEGLEAVVIPADEVATERARDAIPAEVPIADAVANARRRLAAGARPPARGPRPGLTRPARPHPPASPARPLPALDGDGRRAPASSAPSGRRSPVPARPCWSGPPGRTPAGSSPS